MARIWRDFRAIINFVKVRVLDYDVIVKKERYKKGFCYVTKVPALGVVDFGMTVDEALKYTKDAIRETIKTSKNKNGLTVCVPTHHEYLPSSVLRNIIKQSKIPEKEFFKKK